ncbi:MAG: hypothetical protein HQL14_00405 [Candidatus Omnitrophica bacterium]|nr:hypothetical protein [Candidatus Omnitrophota bacterium]
MDNFLEKIMLYLYIVLVILVCALVFLNANRAWFLDNARRCGKLPQKGKATMFDVRHLLMEGEKDLAIQVYCEIFHTIPIKAKKDIEELERSLKV